MSIIDHKQPRGMTQPQQNKLDKITSDSMELYFELKDCKVKNAKLVLLKGNTITHEDKETTWS